MMVELHQECVNVTDTAMLTMFPSNYQNLDPKEVPEPALQSQASFLMATLAKDQCKLSLLKFDEELFDMDILEHVVLPQNTKRESSNQIGQFCAWCEEERTEANSARIRKSEKNSVKGIQKDVFNILSRNKIKDIEYTFKHYLDTHRYMEQYRREHTYQHTKLSPVRPKQTHALKVKAHYPSTSELLQQRMAQLPDNLSSSAPAPAAETQLIHNPSTVLRQIPELCNVRGLSPNSVARLRMDSKLDSVKKSVKQQTLQLDAARCLLRQAELVQCSDANAGNQSKASKTLTCATEVIQPDTFPQTHGGHLRKGNLQTRDLLTNMTSVHNQGGGKTAEGAQVIANRLTASINKACHTTVPRAAAVPCTVLHAVPHAGTVTRAPAVPRAAGRRDRMPATERAADGLKRLPHVKKTSSLHTVKREKEASAVDRVTSLPLLQKSQSCVNMVDVSHTRETAASLRTTVSAIALEHEEMRSVTTEEIDRVRTTHTLRMTNRQSGMRGNTGNTNSPPEVGAQKAAGNEAKTKTSRIRFLVTPDYKLAGVDERSPRRVNPPNSRQRPDKTETIKRYLIDVGQTESRPVQVNRSITPPLIGNTNCATTDLSELQSRAPCSRKTRFQPRKPGCKMSITDTDIKIMDELRKVMWFDVNGRAYVSLNTHYTRLHKPT